MTVENIITELQASSIAATCGGENLRECLTCDKCVSTCFLNDAYPNMNPRELPRKIYEGRIQELIDSEFIWACTLCSRCTVDCPKGLQMDVIVRTLRHLAESQEKAPKRLVEGIEKINETGNSVGIDSQEFVETLEWLGEEAAAEIDCIDEETFSVPIDKNGAEFLYLPNPREYTSMPHMFSVYLEFFSAVKANWTYASDICDISNWAYFMGDQATSAKLLRNIVDTAGRLGVKTLVSTECGHGFSILRRDAEQMLGQPLGFEVVSVVELAHRYFKEGRLRLKQGHVKEVVTYHDPCEVSRKLGVYEPPRELLKFVAQNYIEMTPHGKYGLCCGGGGGVAQNADMGRKRLENAHQKHDQILQTGAAIVTTSCQACLAQLNDIVTFYNMTVKVKSVMELVVESLAD